MLSEGWISVLSFAIPILVILLCFLSDFFVNLFRRYLCGSAGHQISILASFF